MPGFAPETLTFLRDLAADPTPAFFAENRQRYRDHWLAPARHFVEVVGPLLGELTPGLRAEPRVHGSILHPRQDIRFGRDRALYRDHVGLIFWEGERAVATSVLFLRLHLDHVTIGTGARRLTPDVLRRYRAQVIEPSAGRDLVDAAAQVESAGWSLHGETLATRPRSVSSEDPARQRLLRHTALWASDDLPHPGVLGSARFASWCVRRWQQQLPLHRWLTDHLEPKS